jgi:MscS family membrane protein
LLVPLQVLLAANASGQVPAKTDGGAAASPPASREAEADADALAPEPGSPRESVASYLDLARARHYEQAARYLVVPADQRERASVLAERLKAVLDRHLWLDLDLLSGATDGDVDDGLPSEVERIGSIPRPSRSPEPVLLVRRQDEAGIHWAFSRGTVLRVDGWYDTLADRWLRERLPDVLLRAGPHELLWWQWLALPLLLLSSWGAGWLLGRLTLAILGRITARTTPDWDDGVVRSLRRPVTAGWTVVVAYVLLPALALYAPAAEFAATVLRAGGLLAIFWGAWAGIGAAIGVMRSSHWDRLGSSTRSILQIGERLAKVALVALAMVTTLAELGYPVAGLLAGLGLGGLALALAAQKTVENLFGSLALALDRPFGLGDFVRVSEADLVGTVEAIGLRSTQIRTLDRTVVTMPNGRLADMRLESFSARDRMRLACTIGLVYGTTEQQMRQVLCGLENALRSHARIWPDAVVVRLKEFGPSSLDIEIMAWFQTREWPEFQAMRQEILLRFMEVVERAGTSFAFPTRTVHLVAESRPASQPASEDAVHAGKV